MECEKHAGWAASVALTSKCIQTVVLVVIYMIDSADDLLCKTGGARARSKHLLQHTFSWPHAVDSIKIGNKCADVNDEIKELCVQVCMAKLQAYFCFGAHVVLSQVVQVDLLHQRLRCLKRSAVLLEAVDA